jgi:hypothetical protein
LPGAIFFSGNIETNPNKPYLAWLPKRIKLALLGSTTLFFKKRNETERFFFGTETENRNEINIFQKRF